MPNRRAVSWLCAVSWVCLACAVGCQDSRVGGNAGGDAGTYDGVSLPAVLYWWTDDGQIDSSDDYFVKDGYVFVEEDFSIGTVQDVLAEHEEIVQELEHPPCPGCLVMDTRHRRLWKHGVVPFTSKGLNSDQAAAVQQAVDLWNSLTPITGMQWVPRHLKKRNSGVRFIAKGSVCQSKKIGRHPRRYDIELGPGCFAPPGQPQGVIVHEMGHAMGFHHEQQRGDRNSWVAFFSRNYSGKEHDVQGHRRRPRRFTPIGPYDVQSIMQYESTAFLNPGSNLPSFLNRQVLDLYAQSPTLPPTTLRQNLGWNRFVRLDQRGVDLNQMRVADVDGDGYDDLVASLGGQLVWSSHARSGWIPLAPGGQPINAGLNEVAIGRFDTRPGYDVVRIQGTRWDFFSSDGTMSTTQRSQGVRDIETADMNADGLDDVFVVLSDRTWAFASGGQVLGNLTVRAATNMGVDRVKLVPLEGSGQGVHVVSVLGNSLVHVPPGGNAWEPVFAQGGMGPVPDRNLDHLWFVNVEGPRSGPNQPKDLVSWTDDGHAAYVPAVLGSTATQMTVFPVVGTIGIDARDSIAVGYFNSPELASVVTLGFIPKPQVPAASDAAGAGTIYASWTPTRLSERYPLAPDGNVATTVTKDVVPGERIEIEAAFMSPAGLQNARVVLERNNPNGTSTVLSNDLVSLAGPIPFIPDKANEVQTVFQEYTAGTYTVLIVPVSPLPNSNADIPTWVFNVGSSGVCGNGIVEPGEECDDGPANSDTVPDACRTTCVHAFCGDGVVDSNEFCDSSPGCYMCETILG